MGGGWIRGNDSRRSRALRCIQAKPGCDTVDRPVDPRHLRAAVNGGSRVVFWSILILPWRREFIYLAFWSTLFARACIADVRILLWGHALFMTPPRDLFQRMVLYPLQRCFGTRFCVPAGLWKTYCDHGRKPASKMLQRRRVAVRCGLVVRVLNLRFSTHSAVITASTRHTVGPKKRNPARLHLADAPGKDQHI